MYNFLLTNISMIYIMLIKTLKKVGDIMQNDIDFKIYLDND